MMQAAQQWAAVCQREVSVSEREAAHHQVLVRQLQPVVQGGTRDGFLPNMFQIRFTGTLWS